MNYEDFQNIEIAERAINKENMHISTDEKDRKNLLIELHTVFEMMKPFISQYVTIVYPFRQSDQTEKLFQKTDGVTSLHINQKTGKKLYTIGISVEALAKGTGYASMIFMHELTHIIVGSYDHSAAFHYILNRLISRYNAITGGAIENDYFGISEDDRAKVDALEAMETAKTTAAIKSPYPPVVTFGIN